MALSLLKDPDARNDPPRPLLEHLLAFGILAILAKLECTSQDLLCLFAQRRLFLVVLILVLVLVFFLLVEFFLELALDDFDVFLGVFEIVIEVNRLFQISDRFTPSRNAGTRFLSLLAHAEMRIRQVVRSLRGHILVRHTHCTFEFLLGFFKIAELVLARSNIIEQKRICGLRFAGLHVLFKRSGIIASGK